MLEVIRSKEISCVVPLAGILNQRLSTPDPLMMVTRFAVVGNACRASLALLPTSAKRPVSAEKISQLIDSIEVELRNSSKQEISSKSLGDMALERLANVDDVAYIRFASVYKDFKTIDEFRDALKGLY